MRTLSISTGRAPDFIAKNDLPGAGDLIAFDAEFVSVQEEESVLTNTGAKLITRETRYALARVSIIDCRSGSIMVDDYVLPCEPVVDYLTRFSGTVEGDLDPKNSPHHLISMRSAYLKLRCLTER
jgi:PAB-dependent poly(A)-specific ribonuclease subunit 2